MTVVVQMVVKNYVTDPTEDQNDAKPNPCAYIQSRQNAFPCHVMGGALEE